jgi:2-polyprenyl-3-methyl-5-hydroxy-6-metoxy-1,4-benzoquinol methylase
MAEFHFVEDYERHVASLCESHPIDEAMALAVGGGGYSQIGEIERDILLYAGLNDGMYVIDIGCGSGRLASVLSRTGKSLQYIGTDVVQKLLDYAASKSCKHFRFQLPAFDPGGKCFCRYRLCF